jgi:hypothetical protein
MLTRLGQVVSYASFAEFCDHTAAQLDTFHAGTLTVAHLSIDAALDPAAR